MAALDSLQVCARQVEKGGQLSPAAQGRSVMRFCCLESSCTTQAALLSPDVRATPSLCLLSGGRRNAVPSSWHGLRFQGDGRAGNRL